MPRSELTVACELVEPAMAAITAAFEGEYLDGLGHLERAAVILREAEEEREHDALPTPT